MNLTQPLRLVFIPIFKYSIFKCILKEHKINVYIQLKMYF